MLSSALKKAFALLASALGGAAALATLPFDRKGRFIAAISRAHARSILAVSGVRLDVRGRERLDFSKHYVYVSNHASLFDIPAVIAGIPQHVRIVYKKELERIPLFGWGLKFSKGYIGINRGRGADAMRGIEKAAETIRNGASVLLFAEGTRTPDGRLQPFKRGAFNLAVKAGVPVVPLTINGSYRVYSKASPRIQPGTISLTLEDPIRPARADGKEAELRLRDSVQRAIQKNYVDQ